MSDSNYHTDYTNYNQANIIDVSTTNTESNCKINLQNVYENVTRIELIDMSLLIDGNLPTIPVYVNINGWAVFSNTIIPIFYKYDPNSFIQRYDQGTVVKTFKDRISKVSYFDINFYKKDNDNYVALPGNIFTINLTIKIYTKSGVYQY